MVRNIQSIKATPTLLTSPTPSLINMFEESGDWGCESKGSNDLHCVLFGAAPLLGRKVDSRSKTRKRKKNTESPSEVIQDDVHKHIKVHRKDLDSVRLSPLDNGNELSDERKVRKKKRNHDHSKRKIPKRRELTKPLVDISEPVEMRDSRQKTLRSRMASKMDGARFRWLNEQLYTTTGEEAKTMFEEDPTLFQVYHQGFATQVSKWPVNPLERVIDYVKSLPSSLVIADFGCGEARLAQSVRNRVHSFDLVAHNKYVTACDMAHVPLERGSVDVCIFCLSLMGTNVPDFIKEARRVIVEDGRLKVCEIVSRLSATDEFVRGVEAYGFKHVSTETFSTMFIDLEFRAVGVNASKKQKGKSLQLKPCGYKRR